jgi:protein O-GlcNAc transferase
LNTVESAFSAALAMQRRGELAMAEGAYRTLLERFGSVPEAEHMLALTLHAQGRSSEALPWFERASTAGNGSVLRSNHAAALLAVGRAAEAAALARQAAQSDPRHVGAWLNLGLACEIQHNYAEAIAALENVLRIVPGQRVAMRALARCHLRTVQYPLALAVLGASPAGRDPAADLLRCEAWIGMGNLANASALLERLVDANQGNKEALLLQAKIASEQGRGDQAIELLERVLHVDPGNRHAIVRLALIRINRAETEAGLSQLRDWLDQHPEDQVTASSYLIACNYSERFDAAGLLAEHRKRRPVPTGADPWPRGWSSTDRKLRIGWVSSAFSVGPNEIFFADVLAAFGVIAPEIEHSLYAIGGESTAAPPAASWGRNQRDASRLGDRELVDLIRADGNDIVVDMVGRAAGNRLAVFAARVAPVQVGWLDVFYPTGVDTMDYLITDPTLSPTGADAHYSEKLLRLAHGRVSYSPPPAADVRMEGLHSKRFVSLNRFSKLNDSVVAAWAAILRQLPDWTLLLKARGGEDAGLTDVFRERFQSHGIGAGRIEFARAGPYAEAMQTYQDAAVALDPFPFSGCSTSCDALWMGLPVITWPRDTMASRQTAALLQSAGRAEWIAGDAADYVARAVKIAGDEVARREWRMTSRESVRPAFCDAHRFAQELLEALRGVAVARP